MPPKCLFPESKDLPSGIDYRKDPITVSSCPAHNTKRSKDDEYLLYVLPASIGSSDTGLNHFLSKVQRAIALKPSLACSLQKKAKDVFIRDTQTNEWSIETAVPFDTKRVNKVLEMNARALYFHHHGSSYLGKITLYNNFLLSIENPKVNDDNEKRFDIFNQLLSENDLVGNHPNVFTYRFAREGIHELLEMTFYGENKVVAHMIHDAIHYSTSKA